MKYVSKDPNPPRSADLREQVEAMEKLGYITTAEAAKRVHVNVNVIYRALDAGRLEGTQVGGRRYVKLDSFRAYAGPLADGAPEDTNDADTTEDEEA